MNVPVDWPETVTVSTRDLVATMRFLCDNGFVVIGSSARLTILTAQMRADAAERAFDPLTEVLDAKCPGWE